MLLTKPKPDQPAHEQPPISILACGGDLPLEIAQTLRRNGRRTNIVRIAGMADANYEGFAATSVGIGRIGTMLAALRSHGAREMVIAGHARRPDLRKLMIDRGFVRNIGTILSLTRGGDDQVLRRVAAFFERNGLIVRSIADIAPDLLTPAGVLTGNVSPAGQSAAAHGIRLVHKLGSYDVGQAVVVDHRDSVAIEGAEGTDGLLERLPPIEPVCRRHGNTRVLIKAAKPNQDQRVDLPTIGTETIEKCAKADIGMIALEAGRSLIIARNETIKKAEDLGIAIVGLPGLAQSDDNALQVADTPRSRKLLSHARRLPHPQFRRDARKGLHLLKNLHGEVSIKAVLVSRENILAVDVDETIDTFIERSEKLAQWSDRREKSKRNRTLVVAMPGALRPEVCRALRSTKVAGVALLTVEKDPSLLDQLIEFANAENYFVLSPQ